MDNSDDDLQRFTDRLYHAAEQAEAHAEQVNRLVRRLDETGAVVPGIILGPIIQENEYSRSQGPSDSAQAVQAALHLSKGLGVVFWDVEQYAAIKSEYEIQLEAMRQFVPFNECKLVVRAALLPHIQALVSAIRKHLR